MKSRRMRYMGTEQAWGGWKCIQSFVGKCELGRLMSRWKDNIKTDLREIGSEGVDKLSGSGQGPTTGSCEHIKEPLGSLKEGQCLD
jgi:hypothetical protein